MKQILDIRGFKRWSRSVNGCDTAADKTGHRLVACHKQFTISPHDGAVMAEAM